ncbi:hypothetical protein C1702_14320 [Caldimonas thermodepolymerans]|uniref:Uncharacterized protein n=2 Tax=Caldimonas thermodepolymerans TaxID=215580 RepID=A0A2S5T256_9BURK|nr:hypothetical protein C1702_14320 [Caldimonas thermodepolymerans]RDH98234.1 hypothetical protein DES46_107235 [Caldimonas thermodepolymerans]
MRRHVMVPLVLLGVLAGTALAVDALARRSDAGGAVLVWTTRPARLLRTLPPSVRVVRTWDDGRLVQLHAASLRALDGAMLDAPLRLHLSGWAVALAGCG